ncbi:MAG: hypothetical protein WCP96_02735 [Methylococcaceae bacterium]
MNEPALIWWIELIKVTISLITVFLALYLGARYQEDLHGFFHRFKKFMGLGIKANSDLTTLDKAISAQQVDVSQEDYQSVLRRLKLISPRLHGVRVLWVDANHAHTRHERELLEQFGVHITLASTSAQAETALRENVFLIFITDINREGRNTEGLDFVKRIVYDGISVWTIAYVKTFQDGLPRPPYLFGITNRPDHLIHLICDIVDRERL